MLVLSSVAPVWLRPGKFSAKCTEYGRNLFAQVDAECLAAGSGLYILGTSECGHDMPC